jgi:hypothetical protein
MCGQISEFKKSLESRSDDIFSCRYQQRRRHRRRRRSCGSGATTKYRNGTDERNKCNIREKKYADPIDDDGKSMSPSVLEILGLADLGDDDDDDEEYKNGDTYVDDQSFISNNSTISTVSSFFSLLRSRRGAATSSEKKYVIRTNAQNLRLATDYVSSSLPAVLHLNDGECVQDDQVTHNSNSGGGHCKTMRKEEEINTKEWLDDVSHLPTFTNDCRLQN